PQKKEVKKEEEIVAEAGKKKNKKKRKAVGIRIDEERTKKRHDKKAKTSDSGTESDEVTIAQKLKQETSEAYAKEMHQKFSKGKFSKHSRNEPLEAQISGYDIPLTTVLPEPQTIHVSSSSSPDTVELDKEADMLKEGVIKFGETP
ncbi:hypothetical protein A2U01_0054463, partial [Trifolium medium]|nr:hypothetical protein [Trifolium medium]